MRKVGAVALALIELVWPVVAQAQSKSQNQQANDLVKRAIASGQAGDHEHAIELYTQAYDIVPKSILLSNIGFQYEQAKKPVEALKYFCEYLAKDPTGSNASYALAKAHALATELGRPPADDATVCKPPAAKPVERVPDDTGLEHLPPPSSRPRPTPRPSSEPSSDIGERHPGRGLEYTGAAVGAAGVVGLVLGTIYGLKAKDLNDAINGHDTKLPWPSQIDGVPIADSGSQGAAWNRDTYIFLIGGAVALGAGIALFVHGHGESGAKPNESSTSVTIVPTVGGVAALGRF